MPLQKGKAFWTDFIISLYHCISSYCSSPSQGTLQHPCLPCQPPSKPAVCASPQSPRAAFINSHWLKRSLWAQIVFECSLAAV